VHGILAGWRKKRQGGPVGAVPAHAEPTRPTSPSNRSQPRSNGRAVNGLAAMTVSDRRAHDARRALIAVAVAALSLVR